MPNALVPQKYRRIVHLGCPDEGDVGVDRRRERNDDVVRRSFERLLGAVCPLENTAVLGATQRANFNTFLRERRAGKKHLLELRGDEPAAEDLLASSDGEIHHRLDERLDGDDPSISDTHHDFRVPLKDSRVHDRGKAQHVSTRVDRYVALACLVAGARDLEDVNEHRGVESPVDNRSPGNRWRRSRNVPGQPYR